MQTLMAAARLVITPRQREKLVEFFGKKGAAIVVSHIDDLDQTFGSASVIIRKIMKSSEESEESTIS